MGRVWELVQKKAPSALCECLSYSFSLCLGFPIYEAMKMEALI